MALTECYGKGFNKNNLHLYTSFYRLCLDIFHTVSEKSEENVSQDIFHTVSGKFENVLDSIVACAPSDYHEVTISLSCKNLILRLVLGMSEKLRGKCGAHARCSVMSRHSTIIDY